MLNFSSLARLEVPEKFVWWVVVGGVFKVIFMSNPTVVLRLGLGWGFDNIVILDSHRLRRSICQLGQCNFLDVVPTVINPAS